MIEIWGGLECTVNRVGDQYFDQVSRAGHVLRLDDIDRIAGLGVTRVRYLIPWERVSPSTPSKLDFSTVEPFLERLREKGIRVIAGLVHHGSGPRYTSLLDPRFPQLLAEYASAVAKRFPWIDAWTPVNEPGATARFAGLYGHWYPHARSDRAYVRMLLHQCRGIVQSMRAIRTVVQDARLVQTEDAGCVSATPALSYQADFENARQLLTWDLLCGFVTPSHPLYHFLLRNGAHWEELNDFVVSPTPPDVFGLDYYATSDRWLDHDLSRYAPEDIGGNGRDHYADVASAGHQPQWTPGFARALARVAERYGGYVALTEVHLGCTREEQLRWLAEAWQGAQAAEQDGVAVCAVTPWALMGSFNWDVLATHDSGQYEPGAFDVRSPLPRRTAVGHAVAALSAGRGIEHPLAQGPGWWARPTTLRDVIPLAQGSRPIVVFGQRGTLGSAFLRQCEKRGLHAIGFSRGDIDITDADALGMLLTPLRPWAVINATGFVDVDLAERESAACRRLNVEGARSLAFAADVADARYVGFSTDLVFDGQLRSPYVEDQQARPVNSYGQSKLDGERAVLEVSDDALVVRTSAFFGPWDDSNFVTRVLRGLAAGETIHAPDLIVSPTYVPDLADAVLDLIVDEEAGVWHLSNETPLSWRELAHRVAQVAGYASDRIVLCAPEVIGWNTTRPQYSALASARGTLLPTFDRSLHAYFQARAADSVHRQ